MFDVWFTLFALAFCCRFLFRLILNRKLFGNFEFSCMFAKTSYLITLCFFRLLHVLRNQQKTETETKKPHFCRNTSLFAANKTLIFSVLWVYRANYTPPPRFWHSQGGSALLRNFFIFLFFYFCKILRFCQFRFSTEF